MGANVYCVSDGLKKSMRTYLQNEDKKKRLGDFTCVGNICHRLHCTQVLSVSLHLGYGLSLGDVIPTSLILSVTLLEMARG